MQVKQAGVAPGHFPALDIVRAGAALWVMLFHVSLNTPWRPDLPGWAIVEAVLKQGWIGVDIFFVLSGMVIAMAIERLPAASGAVRLRTYLKHRLARLLPLYYLTCAVYLLAVLDTAVPAADLVRHALLVHNLDFESWGSINRPSWSIGLEFQWYLLAFLAYPLLRRARPGLLIAGSLVVTLAWQAFTLATYYGSAEYDRILFMSGQLPGVLFHFVLGSALVRMRPACPAPAASSVLLGGCALFLYLMHRLDLAFESGGQAWLIWVYTFSRIVLAMLIAALIHRFHGAQARAPWARCAAYVGTISYGIYLWHQIVIELLKPHLQGGSLVLATLAAVFLLAALSWAILEKPMLKLARRPAAARLHPDFAH